MRSALPILFLAMAIAAIGCPGFEDEHSGTYRQVIETDEDGEQVLGEELYELELFRYGTNVQGLLRTYEPSNPEADPFATEERCDWTEPAALEEEEFETRMKSGTSRFRVSGRLHDDGRMLVRINRSAGDPTDLTFERVANTPDSACSTIAPLNMFADFAGRTQANAFDDGVYELREPYFGVQWLAVEAQEDEGGLSIFAALRQELVAARVGPQRVTQNNRGLRGQLGVLLEPPREEIRTFSGSTRYSMAYFIVVDDAPDDGPFVWDLNSGEEPIVASGVRRGQRPDAPEFASDHNQFGLAVLFVEDSLLDLEPRLTTIMEGWEEVDPEAHFYLVHVFAVDDRVTGLRFTDQRDLTIPVTVTVDYLDETGMPLPRLFPR